MKRFGQRMAFMIFLFLLTALLSCGGGGGGASSSGPRHWTYMVYMGADNNLSDAGLYNLNEMEKVGSSAGVAIVVQAEFSTKYTTGMPTSDTGRIYVENDNNPNSPNLNTGTSLGNVDMASSAALTGFINWAKTTYPAEHYALVIWDHGSGWKARKASPLRGAVQDETSGTFMSLPDLAKGVADSGVHFDVIDFDACLMAMYEVVYEFNGLTDYMVFSEQTAPGEGDPYQPVLAALAANPAMTGSTLAGTIVNKYDEFYAANSRGGTTKSAVDMSKLATLDTKLLALVSALKTDPTGTAAVLLAQSSIQQYAYPSNRDLWHFSDFLVNSAAGAAVKTAAGEVKTAITSMVVANLTNGTDVANSHGLAIYLPLATETNAQELADYALLACNKTVRSAAAGTWGSYLESLLSGVSGGTASYKTGNFGFYLAWTDVNNLPCDADLDLYVWEPAPDYATSGNGRLHAPYMGQTSPNGFFSLDSSDSGTPEEYYLANSQVLAGDYYVLVNYYANGATCTQAKAHLFYYDPAYFSGDTNWHEVTTANLGVTITYESPVLLDLTNVWTGQALSTLGDLNNYSDWWVPFSITKTGASQFLSGANLPLINKSTGMVLRYKKGYRLFGGM